MQSELMTNEEATVYLIGKLYGIKQTSLDWASA